MCELSKLDTNPQYYNLYKKSAIILINNKFANIDVYIILLYIMTYQEQSLSTEILHLINVILIYMTERYTEYQYLKDHFTGHKFSDLKYRESFFEIFKELDLQLSITILLYHSFLNPEILLAENLVLWGNI